MDIPEQDTNEPDMNEQYPETVAEHQVVENTELPEPVAEHPIVEDTRLDFFSASSASFSSCTSDAGTVALHALPIQI
eukprot:Em0005g1370a